MGKGKTGKMENLSVGCKVHRPWPQDDCRWCIDAEIHAKRRGADKKPSDMDDDLKSYIYSGMSDV